MKNLSGSQEVMHFSFLFVCNKYRELGSEIKEQCIYVCGRADEEKSASLKKGKLHEQSIQEKWVLLQTLTSTSKETLNTVRWQETADTSQTHEQSMVLFTAFFHSCCYAAQQ